MCVIPRDVPVATGITQMKGKLSFLRLDYLISNFHLFDLPYYAKKGEGQLEGGIRERQGGEGE